jgi:triosephosphate isomerase
MFKKGIIVINFKTYEESTGKNAITLAKACTSKNVIICVDALSLKEVSKVVKVPVFAQHVDGVTYGGHTGKLNSEMIKAAGAKGSLINHSEDRYSEKDLENAIAACKRAKITSLVCVQNPREATKVAKLNPDAIAIEPPELIGGNISVTTANPKIITKTIEAVRKVNPKIPVLCGAGVKTNADLRVAVELGAIGVLLASAITKAQDPKKALKRLANNATSLQAEI